MREQEFRGSGLQVTDGGGFHHRLYRPEPRPGEIPNSRVQFSIRRSPAGGVVVVVTGSPSFSPLMFPTRTVGGSAYDPRSAVSGSSAARVSRASGTSVTLAVAGTTASRCRPAVSNENPNTSPIPKAIAGRMLPRSATAP